MKHILSIVCILFILPLGAFANPQVEADAMRDFNNIINFWSNGQFDMLWEYGNNASKSTWSREDFINRMSSSSKALVHGWEKARDISVMVRTENLVYVRAKMTFLNRNSGVKTETVRQFQMIREYDFFRVMLSDFFLR